jgi:hypothetical protein
MTTLPWSERVNMLSINPDAATREDISKMASELSEYMVMEMKRKDIINKGDKLKIKKKKESDPRIAQFFSNFEATWPFDGKPIFNYGRDGKIIKTLLSIWDLDYLILSLNGYFQSEDMFFKKCGYDIPRFSQYTQSSNVLKPSINRDIKKYQDELIKAIDNKNNKTMPVNTLSSEAKKEFYKLGKHWKVLQKAHHEGINIFVVKDQLVDYKCLAGNDE